MSRLHCDKLHAFVSAETIMAVAFAEEMNALKLACGPDGTPQLVDEPYLKVSSRVGSCHMHSRGGQGCKGGGGGGGSF